MISVTPPTSPSEEERLHTPLGLKPVLDNGARGCMTYFSFALSEESIHSATRILARRSLFFAEYVGVERPPGNCPDLRVEDSNHPIALTPAKQTEK